ncbi:hypothetical protein [Paenibacillus sp. 1_12]|uniref:hypothetical protein n=1 Tax=Paenibacillus sp. 1_12 TaxID=1566278 RepID=UPI000B8336F8|nr:hypothetical protein [Paenibacillus sp. 1_12]
MLITKLVHSYAWLKGTEFRYSKGMFKGFESEEEWNKALPEQNQYLKQSYGMDSLEVAFHYYYYRLL